VFPPWRVALKRRCTGLKESTQKADTFSVLRWDYTILILKFNKKDFDEAHQETENMVLDLF